MSFYVAGVISVAVFLLLAFLGLPIAIAMGLVGFWGYAYFTSFGGAVQLAAGNIFNTFTSYELTVCPLFILMGQILYSGGIGEKIFTSGYRIVGKVKGGLAMGTIIGCTGFSAACGSTIATAATMGSVAIPEMNRYRYNKSLSTGTCAAGGSLGILIPPSICFIIYGTVTETSIGKLFIAGIIPGLILGMLFIVSIFLRCHFNPQLGPPGPSTTLREKFKALTGLWEVVFLFLVIMGGLFKGIFTPVESASIGCLLAVVITVLERRITWEKFVECLRATLRTSCMVIFIIANAQIFGGLLAICKIPHLIAEWMNTLSIPSALVMAIIMLTFFLGSLFMETIPLIMILVPIFFPVVTNHGFSPIWFGVAITIGSEMGLITPPVGLNVYTIKGVAPDVPLSVIFKGVWPFVFCMFILLVLLLIWPELAEFLPRLMIY